MTDVQPSPLQPGGPAFPVDDAVLDSVEHALGGSLAVDEDEELVLVGAEYSLHDLLEFLSGYDPSKLVPLDDYGEVVEYVGGALYHPNDVIAALIMEVRRLRALVPAEQREPGGAVAMVECPACKGNGFLFPMSAWGGECDYCDGTGRVRREP